MPIAAVLVACAASGAGGSSLTKEKNRVGRMAKRPRHELNLATAARADDCRNKETLFAHVDDDELRDRVYHDWIGGGPVLRVCTGDGRTDQRPGAGMSEELLKVTLIPRTAVQMVSAGERTGKLSVVMNRVADFCESDLKTAVKTLTMMIEPMMIIVMGLIIGGIAIALLLPVFQISKVVAH